MVKDSFFIITLAKGKKNPLTYLDSSNHENKRKKKLLEVWNLDK